MTHPELQKHVNEIIQFFCIKTNKIICCTFYSLWYFYPNPKEAHKKTGYLLQ